MICYDGNHYDNIITLVVGKSFCITNINSPNKGKWYYEIEQISGPSNNFLAAWIIGNSSYLGVYTNVPGLSYPLFYSYTPDNGLISFLDDVEYKNTVEMDINNLNIKDRIGIGIDIDSRILYFRSNNNVRIIRFYT